MSSVFMYSLLRQSRNPNGLPMYKTPETLVDAMKTIAVELNPTEDELIEVNGDEYIGYVPDDDMTLEKVNDLCALYNKGKLMRNRTEGKPSDDERLSKLLSRASLYWRLLGIDTASDLDGSDSEENASEAQKVIDHIHMLFNHVFHEETEILDEHSLNESLSLLLNKSDLTDKGLKKVKGYIYKSLGYPLPGQKPTRAKNKILLKLRNTLLKHATEETLGLIQKLEESNKISVPLQTSESIDKDLDLLLIKLLGSSKKKRKPHHKYSTDDLGVSHRHRGKSRMKK